MLQPYLNRAVAVAALAAVMVGCLIPLNKVDAQGTTEFTLRKKVTQFLAMFQKGLPPSKESDTSIKFVDLNGDGIPEALVIINDPQWCGSHGCSAFVLDLRGPAAKDIGILQRLIFSRSQPKREGGATFPLSGLPSWGKTGFASMGEFTTDPKRLFCCIDVRALSRSRVLDKQKANGPRHVTLRPRLRAMRSSLRSEAFGEYALMRDGVGR
jgi:hypothetical protein